MFWIKPFAIALAKLFIRKNICKTASEKTKKEVNHYLIYLICSRDEKTRTSDLHVPNVARYQLCYIPFLITAAKVQLILNLQTFLAFFLQKTVKKTTEHLLSKIS